MDAVSGSMASFARIELDRRRRVVEERKRMGPGVFCVSDAPPIGEYNECAVGRASLLDSQCVVEMDKEEDKQTQEDFEVGDIGNEDTAGLTQLVNSHVVVKVLQHADGAKILDPAETTGDEISTKTNLPMKMSYLRRISERVQALHIIEDIERVASVQTSEKAELRTQINRRLSQVNVEKNLLDKIADSMSSHKGNPLFIKLFVDTMFIQGKVQVKLQPISYIGYAYTFCRLYTKSALLYYMYRLFERDRVEIGCYLILFGIMKLKQIYEEADLFMDAIINEKANDETCEVITGYLSVLGTLLKKNVPAIFDRICENIKFNIVPRVKEVCVLKRVEYQLNKLCK